MLYDQKILKESRFFKTRDYGIATIIISTSSRKVPLHVFPNGFCYSGYVANGGPSGTLIGSRFPDLG